MKRGRGLGAPVYSVFSVDRHLRGGQANVDPGVVFDISLAGVSPGAYGVHVTSDRDVGAAVRLVRSGGEYPARSGSLAHDVG